MILQNSATRKKEINTKIACPLPESPTDTTCNTNLLGYIGRNHLINPFLITKGNDPMPWKIIQNDQAPEGQGLGLKCLC